MALHPSRHATWATYVERFHAEHPGITERILGRCRAGDVDPYQWCARPLAGWSGPVLDVACGSGPLADRLDGWIGVDASQAELGAARDRRRSPVLRGSATCLPVRTASLGAAVCSMSLQIIHPIAAALAEVARVLRPGGRAVLLLPSSRPVPLRTAMTYLRLQVALRRRIRYPNDDELRPRPLCATAARSGLAVVLDERRAFRLPLTTGADADDLLTSLYLPGVPRGRLDAGRRALEGSIGGSLTVPLRRIVLERTGTNR